MNPFEELFAVAEQLTASAATRDEKGVSSPLQALKAAASELSSSFSGSWLGYHSRVYYHGLVPAPAGANFSQEWGLQDLSFTSLGSRGDWEEYEFETVVKYIHERAGNPDLTAARTEQKRVEKVFDS